MSKTKTTGRPSVYPWSRWFKRKRVILSPDDYSASQRSMCVMIRQQARLHNVLVSVFKGKDGTIEFIPRGQREF